MHVNRRQFLKQTAAMTASLIASPTLTAAGQPPRRPNILFILADDMGLMDTPLYGSRYYETPNLERLAHRGMLFTNAYAASPLCSPTRASIMTGRYPARLRITTPACHLKPLAPGQPLLPDKAAPHLPMITPESRRFLKLEEYTIGEAFRDSGYKTGFIGKWHLGLEPQYWPREQGFTYDLGAPNPGPPSYFSPYRLKTIHDGPEGEYITDRVTDETLKYLDANKDGPFMLCLWHFAVHAPFQAKEELTKRYREKTDPRGFQDCPVMASMIQSLDESIGRVLDKLDALGIADDTIIIFMSDNGGNMYDEVEGTTPTNNRPLRGGKGNTYEGGTREPCIIVWPGVTKPDSRCDELVSSIDFYATMLEMAAIAPNPDYPIDGLSIVPLLKGADRLAREAIFCHFPHYTPATQNRPSTYVRKGPWKLIRFYGEGPDRTAGHELYNLDDDLGERNNLAPKMPEKVRELSTVIDGFLRDTDALVPIPNPAYKPAPRGWWPSKDATLQIMDDTLQITSTGGDPYIHASDLPVVSGPMVFEFEIRSSLSGRAAFFWTDSNVKAFSPNQRIDFSISHDGEPHKYHIPFNAKGRLTALRLDPGTTPGRARITSITLRRKYGELLKSWQGTAFLDR